MNSSSHQTHDSFPMVDGSLTPSHIAHLLLNPSENLRIHVHISPKARTASARVLPSQSAWLFRTQGNAVNIYTSQETIPAHILRTEVTTDLIPCCNRKSCKTQFNHTRIWLVTDLHENLERLLLTENIEPPSNETPRWIHELTEASTQFFKPVDSESNRAIIPSNQTIESMFTKEPFQIHTEGDFVVLRQHAATYTSRSKTLRTTSLIITLFAVLGLISSIALWFQHFYSYGTAALIACVLLSITAYACYTVSRFVSAYRCESFPILAIGRDRMIFYPWTTRDGGISPHLEGRLGAGIPLAHVYDVMMEQSRSLYQIKVNTIHGRYDLLQTTSHTLAAQITSRLNELRENLKHRESTIQSTQLAA